MKAKKLRSCRKRLNYLNGDLLPHYDGRLEIDLDTGQTKYYPGKLPVDGNTKQSICTHCGAKLKGNKVIDNGDMQLSDIPLAVGDEVRVTKGKRKGLYKITKVLASV